MAKCLVIGSTVCDVMIYLDRLPSREGDAHIKRQQMSLGGCAFNVAQLLHHLQLDYDFISPVGTGLYGQFVTQELAKLGMATSIRLAGANGCCYCFVEADGERTFLSDHGVEYSFQADWLVNAQLSDYDYVYVCGLEVEEATGSDLVASLSAVSAQLIFAPGPRGHLIAAERLSALYELSPILHLNEAEAIRLGASENLEQAVLNLYAKTQQSVVVTLGAKGVLAYDGSWHHVAAYLSHVCDTVGAGDCHAGALLAALANEKTLDTALDFANQVSSRVVAVSGVHLAESDYQDLRQLLMEKDSDKQRWT